MGRRKSTEGQAESLRQVRFLDSAGSERIGKLVENRIEYGSKSIDPESVRILPPSTPTKIVCVGLNYARHVEEVDSDMPERPLLFFKTPNAIAGHRDTITLPAGKDRIDYAGELGVIIEKQCRNVSVDAALDVVGGYTCVNDISNRDDQYKEQNWVRGKSFDNAAPIGPVKAPPESVPEDASIEVRQNGEVTQSSSIDDLIFGVPEIIAEITDLITLEPGDIVSTGTPAGISTISDGDTVEVEIEGVGTLRNDFVIPDTEGESEPIDDFLPGL